MVQENAWYAQTSSFIWLQSIKNRLRRFLEGHRSSKELESLLEEIFLDKMKTEIISNIIDIKDLKELEDFLRDLTKGFIEEEPVDTSPIDKVASEPAKVANYDFQKDFIQRVKEAPARKEFIRPSDKTRDPFELARAIGLNLEIDYDYNSAIGQVLESSLAKEHKFILLRFLLEDKFPNMDEDKLELAARALWKRIDN